MQELAYALRCRRCLLARIEAGGVALEDARRMIFFRLSADADQFMTMAKFRALRKLWARVEEASGLAPQPIFIAAETAWRMMTQRDPYVNMLRVTIATFAAGLGGANAVTVLPFTSALGLPDAFARRVARNTQLVLLEDPISRKCPIPPQAPAVIEDLTDQLLPRGMDVVSGDRESGRHCIGPRIRIDSEQGRGDEKRAREGHRHAQGSSHWHQRVPASFREGGRSVLQAAPQAVPAFSEKSLPCIRLAEPFEKLRDASDAMLKRTGQRPKVFLATLGKPADSIARTTFARNFFEAGGIEAVEFSSPLPDGERSTPKASGEGEQTSRENIPSPAPRLSARDRPLPMGEVKSEFAALASAFTSSGAAFACLCSSDEVYAIEAADAAKALSEAGAQHIYLAGRPGELAEAFDKAGIRHFIYAGCDAVGILQAAYGALKA